MKALVGIALALVAMPSMAQDVFKFDQYAAVTEAAYMMSRDCKREITFEGFGSQCERLFEYLPRYKTMMDNFVKAAEIGMEATYGNASQHLIDEQDLYSDRLNSNILFITEMIR